MPTNYLQNYMRNRSAQFLRANNIQFVVFRKVNSESVRFSLGYTMHETLDYFLCCQDTQFVSQTYETNSLHLEICISLIRFKGQRYSNDLIKKMPHSCCYMVKDGRVSLKKWVEIG